MVEISVIEQVEGFYSSAWSKLLISGGIVFAVLVIILPLIFYAFNFKLLKAKLGEKFNLLKLETVAELRNQNREELAQVKQDFYNKSRALKSMSLHLEANSLLKDRKVELAAMNYLEAIKGYLHGKDFVNFRLLVNALIDKCLPKLNQLQLVNIFKRMDTSEEEYFAELKKIDRSEYARQEIVELRLQMEMVAPAEMGKG
ncbi:MAG: hypothetical protein LBU92_06460 [Prevotellaceae bacterium]|nr:hypothetical protein [Prevotellaceae bacterium]